MEIHIIDTTLAKLYDRLQQKLYTHFGFEFIEMCLKQYTV